MENQSTNNPQPDNNPNPNSSPNNAQPDNNPNPNQSTNNPQLDNNPNPNSSPNNPQLNNNTESNDNRRSFTPSFFGSFLGTSTLFLFLGLLGHIANIITVASIIPISDPKIKTGWFITEIIGSGNTMYDKNVLLKILDLFNEDIGSSSKIRSMIYTDFPIKESELSKGGGFDNLVDLSVLINKDQDFDYEKLGYLVEQDDEKINSQSLQARLIKANKNQEVLCIAVTGYRDNEKSEFFNILDVKSIASNKNRNYKQEYQ